jgi:hypothetical protein
VGPGTLGLPSRDFQPFEVWRVGRFGEYANGVCGQLLLHHYLLVPGCYQRHGLQVVDARPLRGVYNVLSLYLAFDVRSR